MDTSKWTQGLDEMTAAFKREFGNLTALQLNYKINSASWSIAQCIDHLIVLNSSCFAGMKNVQSGKNELPWTGKVGFIVNFFGSMILTSVLPETRRKTRTFPIWEPSYSDIDVSVLSRFEQNQEELKALMVKSSPFLDQGAVVSSPSKRIVVYKLETQFDMLVAHERRHFNQAKDVMKWMRTVN